MFKTHSTIFILLFLYKILRIRLTVKIVKNWKLKLNFCYFCLYSKFNNLKKKIMQQEMIVKRKLQYSDLS